MSKCLIVIDCQNDFIDGSLGTKEAREIIPNVKRKIESFKKSNEDVIFTRDTHYCNYLRTNEGHNLPIEHCIRNTFGWKISEELDTSFAKMILDKSTFGVRDWNYFNFEYEEIVIVGLCTDICVISNALLLKTFYPETKIIVDASCCAGVTPEKHLAAIEVMKSCQIEIIGE